MTGRPAGAVLDCLADIAREHEAYATSELRVIPVLYRSVDADLSNPPFTTAVPLVAEAARFLGGDLLDAAEPNLRRAVAADSDAVLQGHLPAAVSGLLRPGTELEVHHTGTTVDAVLTRGGTAIVAAGGEATFLAVVRALFMTALRSSPFAVLAYSEAELDRRTAQACFQMLCGLQDHPGGLSRLRTLVILVETPAENPVVHCPQGVGARYLLKAQRLIERREPSALRSEVSRLVQGRDRPLVLFLGAGFSVSSKLPAGNTLRDAAIARILGEDPKAAINWPFELYRRQYNRLTSTEKGDIDEFARRLTFEQVIRIEMEHTGDAIPQGLRDFERLHSGVIGRVPGTSILRAQAMLSRPEKLVVLTVNFDELLEHNHADRLDVIVDDGDFAAFAADGLEAYLTSSSPARKIPYLKLHGTIGQIDSCVASSRQTQQGLPQSKEDALGALIGCADRLRWVYVGASMRDEDLRPFFDGANFKSVADERWVAPFPDPNVEAFARSREQLSGWLETPLNRRLITETSDVFMAALAFDWAAAPT